MHTSTLHRNIFQRLFGICATKPPLDEGCWTFEDGSISVELDRAPELTGPNGALRAEGKNLRERVLVVKGDDGQYYALRNRCTHAGRRLDPIPGSQQVQCCSIGRSTYDCDGNRLSGSAKEALLTYAVTTQDGKLLISLRQADT